jgi:hypothetical protein
MEYMMDSLLVQHIFRLSKYSIRILDVSFGPHTYMMYSLLVLTILHPIFTVSFGPHMH